MEREAVNQNPLSKKINFKCLDSFTLKLIAVISMTIDHIGAVLLPQYVFLRIIGRIAFPIYAYLIVVGYFHTSNVKKYIMRLALFGIISEPFFDLALFGKPVNFTHQNVFITLALGLILVAASDKIAEKNDGRNIRRIYLMQVFLILVVCIIAYILKSDYNVFGILLIYGMYRYRFDYLGMFWVLVIINALMIGGSQSYAMLSILFIYCYNDRLGPERIVAHKSLKYAFYVYYPIHLFVLYLIGRYVMHI